MALNFFCGKKKIFSVFFILIVSLLVISPVIAAPGDYTPLVPIPGVSANAGLFEYLSGVYNFLISIVGILAMAVLVYGGMRYVTSAGNTASVEEAKESINSAIAGLILALVSWLIFATINKDILVLKNPGVGLSDSVLGDNNSVNKCVESPLGNGTSASPCRCIDGMEVFSATGASGVCNDICGDKDKALNGRYHCIKAVVKAVASTGLTHEEYKIYAREYKTADNPLTIPSGTRIAFDGVHYSTFNYPPVTACLDGWYSSSLLNGNCDNEEKADAGNSEALRYNDYATTNNIDNGFCFTVAAPASIQCRFHFLLIDGQSGYSVGLSAESDLWIRILRP